MNRKEFQNIARERLDDAQVLLRARRYSGAYYFAGYAVEYALKACIARQTKAEEFPPKDTNRSHYTHDLATLIATAGLAADLRTEENRNARFRDNWALVRNWKAEARYQGRKRAETAQFLAAITDRSNGILQWLKTYW